MLVKKRQASFHLIERWRLVDRVPFALKNTVTTVAHSERTFADNEPFSAGGVSSYFILLIGPLGVP